MDKLQQVRNTVIKILKRKNIIKQVLSVVFLLSGFAILALTGSFEQLRITAVEYIIYCAIAFIALGVSGFLSGMLTVPDERSRKLSDVYDKK